MLEAHDHDAQNDISKNGCLTNASTLHTALSIDRQAWLNRAPPIKYPAQILPVPRVQNPTRCLSPADLLLEG